MSSWCNFYVCSARELAASHKDGCIVPELVDVFLEAQVATVMHGSPQDEWLLEALTRRVGEAVGQPGQRFDLARCTRLGGGPDTDDSDGVYVLPADWVAALASVQAGSLPEITRQVSQDLMLSTAPDDMQPLVECLQEISDLCRTAQNLRQDVVYSWTGV